MTVKLEDLVKGRQRLGLDLAPPAAEARVEVDERPRKPAPPPGPSATSLLSDLLRVAETAGQPLRAFLVAWILAGVVSYLFLAAAWRALTWPWRRREKE